MSGILDNGHYVTWIVGGFIACGGLSATVWNIHDNIVEEKRERKEAIKEVRAEHNADVSELKKLVETLGKVENRQIRTEVISEVTLTEVNKLAKSLAIMSSKLDKRDGAYSVTR